MRKSLCHHPPFPVADAWYFITLCAANRTGSPFVDHASAILNAARCYHRIGKWFAALFLVMPDHLHALLHFPPDGRACRSATADGICDGRACRSATAAINNTTNDALKCDCGGQGTDRPTVQHRPIGMAKTIADFKHYLSLHFGLSFQRDFFDTRIRDAAHYAEKFRYICANPVRKNLCATPRDWPFVIAFDRATGDERPHR